MKISDVKKTQTKDSVYQRMLLRVLDPEHKDAYRSDLLCHSVAIDYVKKHGMATNMLVMVGDKSGRVMHSFVTDFHGTILADSMKNRNPSFDGKMYRNDKIEYRFISHTPVRQIKRDFNTFEGR